MGKLEGLLDPEVIKKNLILSSLYLSAFELLRDSIVDRIKGFFSFDFKDGEPIVDSRYKDEVASLDRDPLKASCLWLEKMEAISQSEITEIEDIRTHRNVIAHELPRLLAETGFSVHIGHFLGIRRLLEKIDVWWIRNVDIPANADYDEIEVEEAEVQSGRVIMLDYLVSIATSGHQWQSGK